MLVSVLVPSIHDRPTGGNIYNRRIVENLEHSAQVVPWAPEEDVSPAGSLSGSSVVVVDSLLVRHTKAVRRLRAEYPHAVFVLMVHYLHCIDPHERDSARATAERSLVGLFEGAVTTSQYAKRALEAEGMAGDRVAVVAPGLDEVYRAPVSLSTGAGPPRLLTVANLLPGKGLLPLLDVLRQLQDEDWTWTLVGDASLDPDFARSFCTRLRGANLTDRMTCPGTLSTAALRRQYDRADVFVLPSQFETCSMATREAMARGCPVVAFSVGGLPENIGDVPAGHLVPSGATAELASALRGLLTDPMARAQQGRAAWCRSRSFPTWATAADRFAEALDAFRSGERTGAGEEEG